MSDMNHSRSIVQEILASQRQEIEDMKKWRQPWYKQLVSWTGAVSICLTPPQFHEITYKYCRQLSCPTSKVVDKSGKSYIDGVGHDLEQLGIKHNLSIQCSPRGASERIDTGSWSASRDNKTGKKSTEQSLGIRDNLSSYFRSRWASGLLRRNFILISFGSEILGWVELF